MVLNPSLCVVALGFAILGIWTLARWIANGWKRFMATVNDLTTTLKDAAEVAKAYREDVQILKQIAQASPTAHFGDEPESIIPQQPERPPASMPSPYFNRFPVKPEEPEAPLERAEQVDRTPTDEDLVAQEGDERASDFEAQERLKAASREADQKRLEELAEQSGEK